MSSSDSNHSRKLSARDKTSNKSANSSTEFVEDLNMNCPIINIKKCKIINLTINYTK